MIEADRDFIVENCSGSGERVIVDVSDMLNGKAEQIELTDEQVNAIHNCNCILYFKREAATFDADISNEKKMLVTGLAIYQDYYTIFDADIVLRGNILSMN